MLLPVNPFVNNHFTIVSQSQAPSPPPKKSLTYSIYFVFMYMFGFGGKDKIIEKARKISLAGKKDRALGILENAITGEEDDLPLILEIIDIYSQDNRTAEIVIWLKKGEVLSTQAKQEMLAKAEDIYYATKSAPIAEYLLEKKISKDDFDGVWRIISEISETEYKKLLKRYENLINNIIKNRPPEEWSKRDINNIYITAILFEKTDFNKTREMFRKVIDTHKEEIPRVERELYRSMREMFGDPGPHLLLGYLMFRKDEPTKGCDEINKAVSRNEKIIPDAIQILETFKDSGGCVLELLSNLYIKLGAADKAVGIVEGLDVENAIQKYRTMLSAKSGSADVRLRLADAYKKAEKFREAITEYLNVIEDAPEKKDYILDALNEIMGREIQDSEALFRAVRLYTRLNEYDKAFSILSNIFKYSPELSSEIIEEAKVILESAPENIRGIQLYAILIAKKGKPDEGIEKIEELAGMGENGLTLAKEGLRQILKFHPEHKIGTILSAILEMKNAAKKSSEMLNEIIEKDPAQSGFIVKNIDKWMRKHPDYGQSAVDIYKNLKAENLPPFTLPFAIAEALAVLNKWDEAKEYYLKALKSQKEKKGIILRSLIRYAQKGEKGPNLVLLDIYTELKEIDKVSSIVQEIVDKYPDYLKEGITYLTTLLKSYSTPSLYIVLVNLLLKGEFYDEVIEYGKRAMDVIQEEKRAPIYFALGKAYIKTKDYRSGAELIKKSTEMDKAFVKEGIEFLEDYIGLKNIAVSENLSGLYQADRKYDLAANAQFEIYKLNPEKKSEVIGRLREILDEAPVNPTVHLRLGEILLSSGEREGAQHIRKAVRFNPSLFEEAVNTLSGFKDSSLYGFISYLIGEMYEEKGKDNDAIKYYISAYWQEEEKRKDIFQDIRKIVLRNNILPDIGISLLSVYAREGFIDEIANILNKIYEKENVLGTKILQETDKVFGDKVPARMKMLKAKILKDKEDEVSAYSLLREAFDEDNALAEPIKKTLEGFKKFNPASLLSDIHIYLKEWNRAIEVALSLSIDEEKEKLEKVLEGNPDMDEVKKRLGIIYIVEGNKEMAKSILTGVQEKESEERVILWALGEGEMPGAEEINNIRKMIIQEKAKNAPPEEKFSLLLKIGDYDSAKDAVNEITEENEKKLAMSRLYKTKGEFQKSVDMLISIPNQRDILPEIINNLIALKRFNEALTITQIARNKGLNTDVVENQIMKNWKRKKVIDVLAKRLPKAKKVGSEK